MVFMNCLGLTAPSRGFFPSISKVNLTCLVWAGSFAANSAFNNGVELVDAKVMRLVCLETPITFFRLLAVDSLP